jgi:hypothetical protein
VVIAAIDEQSVDELGRWPWPYTVQAQLIRRLTSYGAAAIGYDVVFSSSDTSAGPDNLQTIQASLAARGYYNDAELQALVEHTLAAADHDQLFATALQDSGRTILGYFFHWQCQDVAHLAESELERFFHNLTISTNPRYVPRVEPGASLSALHLTPACAVESNLPVLSQAVWGNGFFSRYPRAYARGTWDLKPEIQLNFARIDFLLKLNISFDDVFVDPDRGGEKTDGPKFVPPVYLLDPGKTLAHFPTRVGFDLANDVRYCILGGNHDHQVNMIDLDAQRLDFNIRMKLLNVE